MGAGKYSFPSVYGAPLILEDKIITGFVRHTTYSYPAVLAVSLQNNGFIDEIIWYGTDTNKQVGGFGNVRFTPAYHEGYIILGNPYSNKVYAIDENDGKVVWETSLGQSMFQHWSSPIVKNGSLFVARHDGYLHRLNPKNGKRIWSIFLGMEESSGLVFLEEDEVPGSKFRTQWSPSAAFPIFSTPAYSRGMLAVGTDEGYLYVINTKEI